MHSRGRLVREALLIMLCVPLRQDLFQELGIPVLQDRQDPLQLLLHLRAGAGLRVQIHVLKPPAHRLRQHAEDVPPAELHGDDVPEPDRQDHHDGEQGQARLQQEVILPGHACHGDVKALLPDEADEDAGALHELAADHVLLLRDQGPTHRPCRLLLAVVRNLVKDIDEDAAQDGDHDGEHDAQDQLPPIEEGRQQPLRGIHEAPGKAEAQHVHPDVDEALQHLRRQRAEVDVPLRVRHEGPDLAG
mmetsp:Transcript_65550/g.191841  ORF Transcript_65550/g.191841 Transcript_65550/m.191841 type:complete len:246 (-) Transcript_65550:789-1526(-)